jgi:hypothetical protein
MVGGGRGGYGAAAQHVSLSHLNDLMVFAATVLYSLSHVLPKTVLNFSQNEILLTN